MQRIFKVPARITTIDYIGTTSTIAASYRTRALNELFILQEHADFNSLQQYKRSVTPAPGVRIECTAMFGVMSAIIIIGTDSSISIAEHACFCTAHGVLAGRIVKLHDEDPTAESVDKHYVTDMSYSADILVCQKTGSGTPKLMETREVTEVAGASKEVIRSRTSSEFYISEAFYNIPFTDRYPHSPGELVLVLCMPLVDYRPPQDKTFMYGVEYSEKEGAWSPETNMRYIVSGDADTTGAEAQITARYVNSAGATNIITVDSSIWDTEKDSKEDTRTTEELALERRYCPFRILPMPMDSCFTGYK